MDDNNVLCTISTTAFCRPMDDNNILVANAFYHQNEAQAFYQQNEVHCNMYNNACNQSMDNFIHQNGGYCNMYNNACNKSMDEVLQYTDNNFIHQNEVQCNIYEPQYRDYTRDPGYVQQGTLREYLQNNHSKLTLNDRITLFQTLCASLHDIHDRGLIYRNLHSGKILVQAGKCYITDLGLCGPVDGKNEKDGMIPYIAPEVLRKRSTNTKESDVYGIGMLMWEIFSGGPPFDNMTHDHCLILEICKEDLRPPILPNMPEEYAEIMQECWDVDPSKRPTIGELYKFARDFSANVYDINNNYNNNFFDHNTHNNVDNSINNMNKTHQNPTSVFNNDLKTLFTHNSFDNNNNNLDTAFDDNQVEVKNNTIKKAVSRCQPHYGVYIKNQCLPCRSVKKKCALPGKDCSSCGNESCVFDHSPRKNRRVGNLNRQTERLQKTLRRTQTNCDNIKENLNHIQKDSYEDYNSTITIIDIDGLKFKLVDLNNSTRNGPKIEKQQEIPLPISQDSKGTNNEPNNGIINENKGNEVIRTILLIGRTGSGKSTVANIISGTKDFKESAKIISETKNIKTEFYKVMKEGTNENKSYLQEKLEPTSWNTKLKFSYEIASAVSCLHENNIIHQDLHSKNFLIHQKTIKLSDFGLSKRLESTTNSAFQLAGVLLYVDPQCFKHSDNKIYKKDKNSDVQENFESISWDLKLKFAYEIASVVSCLNENNIIHRDLRQNNFLVHQETIKLSDFGLSKRLEFTTTSAFQLAGVLPYVDPQCFKHSDNKIYKKDKNSDVYSVGVLLWELTSRQLPFSKLDQKYGLALSISQRICEEPILKTPDEYINLYKVCWQDDSKSRPGIQYVRTIFIGTISGLIIVDNEENNEQQKNEDGGFFQSF